MTEAIGTTETSVITRATRHNIPEDTILNIAFVSQYCISKKQLVFPKFLKNLEISETNTPTSTWYTHIEWVLTAL
jgi:hypothetical protein